MPMMQKELARIQFRNDFLEAQARYDMLEPEDDIEATNADDTSIFYADDLAVHFYSVRYDS